jgi:hypothetical protein
LGQKFNKIPILGENHKLKTVVSAVTEAWKAENSSTSFSARHAQRNRTPLQHMV